MSTHYHVRSLQFFLIFHRVFLRIFQYLISFHQKMGERTINKMHRVWEIMKDPGLFFSFKLCYPRSKETKVFS